MRILITGGAGFIGSHLCDRFLAEGHQVIAMDNLITGSVANIEHLTGDERFRFIKQDVTEYLYIDGPLDAVLHFASPASPASYLEYPIQTLKVGALGSHKALGLARAKGARFLLASTSEVYGDPLVHPQREDYWGNVNPVGPRGVYDEAKRFAEAMTMAYHRFHGLDTRIVRIFNSIVGTETVIFFNDGVCHLGPIEEHACAFERAEVLRPRQIYVPAFDPRTGTISLCQASALIKHPANGKDAYRVTTRYGRQIQVTGDHSLFKRKEDGRPVATPVRELAIGDYIAIPGRLPVIERDVTSVNIAEHLIQNASTPDELWDYAIISLGLTELVTKHKELIYDILDRSTRFDGSNLRRNTIGCAYRKYLHNHILPLYVIAELCQYVPFAWPKDSKIRPYVGGGGAALPNEIVISDELLWLLGLYLAEGSLYEDKGTYFISFCSDTEFLMKAKGLMEDIFETKVGYVAPTKKRGPSIYSHSKVLCYLFDQIFGLGGLSGELRIPTWILQLPLSRLKYFLEGYRQGDGTHTNYLEQRELAFNTASEHLATDLTYLLLRYGIVASLGRYETTFKQAYGERKFPFWRVTVCEVSSFDILIWDQGVEQTLNATRFGDLVWVPIKNLERIESTPYVYDFSVPEAENFVAGHGVCCHNTYGPRMQLDDGRVVPNFVGQALRGEPLTVHGDGSQTRSFCYVDDLVEGIYRLLMTEDLHEPINLGNPEEISILEFALKINAITGNPAGIVYQPRPVDDPSRRCPDISQARELLGWEPKVGLEEGLERTIEWFRRRISSG